MRWQEDQLHDRSQALQTDIKRLDRALNSIYCLNLDYSD
jgi:hypothetical protein